MEGQQMNAAIIPILPAIQLKRILYATDFSEASRRALPIVSALAKRYGSQVYVVNVWSTLPYSMVTPEAMAVMENKQEQDVKSDMARLLQTSELQGLQTTSLLKSGEPLDEIRRIVEDQQIDLAVIATHGRTGIRHLLMGSVAEELLRSLSCPVLTVGPHLANRFTEPREISNSLSHGPVAGIQSRVAISGILGCGVQVGDHRSSRSSARRQERSG
jgi:nucleotide-binding universal stress UspA family protein